MIHRGCHFFDEPKPAGAWLAAPSMLTALPIRVSSGPLSTSRSSTMMILRDGARPRTAHERHSRTGRWSRHALLALNGVADVALQRDDAVGGERAVGDLRVLVRRQHRQLEVDPIADHNAATPDPTPSAFGVHRSGRQVQAGERRGGWGLGWAWRGTGSARCRRWRSAGLRARNTGAAIRRPGAGSAASERESIAERRVGLWRRYRCA